MENSENLEETVIAMTQSLLVKFDEFIPERGEFADLRVSRTYCFGDPSVVLPGCIEFVLMSMDPKLDPSYDYMRFLSIRVMKSRDGGWSSHTCLHSRKADLKKRLSALLEKPQYLMDRICELSEGLPEETNPDLWR